MDSNAVVAVAASVASLLTAAGGVWVAVRNAGRQAAVADVQELKAHRRAWTWALRTIAMIRAYMARLDIAEPDEWRIDDWIERHESDIAGESERSKK